MPNIRIVRFNSQDELADKLDKWIDHNKKQDQDNKITFSKFLARTTLIQRLGGMSKNDTIIADLSNQKIIGQDFTGLDFGEVIMNGTIFDRCDFIGARIGSKAGMENLKFTNQCNLKSATIEGDIGGVIIQNVRNIHNLDLTKASGLAKCRISNTKFEGSGVKVPFSSMAALEQYRKSVPVEIALKKYGIPEIQPIDKNDTYSLTDVFSAGAATVAAAPGVVADAALNAAAVGLQTARDAAQTVVEAASAPVYSKKEGGMGFFTRTVLRLWNASPRILTSAPQENSTLEENVAAPPPQSVDSVEPAFVPEPHTIESPKQIYHCTLEGIDLEKAHLDIDDLRTWNSLKGAETLEQYAKSIGKEPIVKGKFAHLTFKGKDFGEVTFAECDFQQCRFSEKSNMKKVTILDSKMENTTFNNVDADGMVCKRNQLSSCNIVNSNMARADFTESQFKSTNIENTSLQNSSFHRADFRETTMKVAYLDNAQLDHVTGVGLTLEEITCNNVDFSSSTLVRAKMSKVDLTEAVAHDLRMPEAEISDCSFKKMQANSMQLQQSEIQNTTFEGSHLFGSDFSGAIDISNVTFDNANLERTRFQNSRIKECTINEAKAMGIDFSGSVIKDLTITNCDMPHALMGAYIDELGASHKAAKIENSNINNVDFTGAIFAGAEFFNSKVENSRLEEANLVSTKILGGSLEGSNFKKANMTEVTIGQKADAKDHQEMSTKVKDVQMDVTTNLVNAKIADLQAEVSYTDKDRRTKKVSLSSIKEKSEKVDKTAATNPILRWGSIAVNEIGSVIKYLGKGMSNVGRTITRKHTSRTGAILGAAAGLIVGTAMIAATAASLGAALIPAAAIVMGSLTVGGGIAGHVMEHTRGGRGFFSTVATAAAAPFLGVKALLVGPAFLAANLILGHGNAATKALGSALSWGSRAFLKAGTALQSFTYSNDDIVEAEYVKDIQTESRMKMEAAKAALAEKKPDEQEKRQSKVRSILMRPFAKRGKKEAEIGIIHVGDPANQQDAAVVPSARPQEPSAPPPAPKYRMGPMGAFLRWKKKVFGKKKDKVQSVSPVSDNIPPEEPAPDYTIDANLRNLVSSSSGPRSVEEDTRSRSSSMASELTDHSGWGHDTVSQEQGRVGGRMEDNASSISDSDDFYSATSGNNEDRGIQPEQPEIGNSGLNPDMLRVHEENLAHHTSHVERERARSGSQSLSDIREQGPKSLTARRKNSLDPNDIKARTENERAAVEKKK